MSLAAVRDLLFAIMLLPELLQPRCRHGPMQRVRPRGKWLDWTRAEADPAFSLKIFWRLPNMLLFP
jgi:hypothetical protein